MSESRSRSALSWVLIVALGVWLGNLLHDATLMMGSKLWVQQHVADVRDTIHDVEETTPDRLEDGKQRGDGALGERAVAPRLRHELCAFWQLQHEQNASERTARGLIENCD